MVIRIIYALLFLLSIVNTNAQIQFSGTWSGKLQVGVSLPLVLHIKDSTAIYVSMDSPDQKLFGLKADQAIVTGDSITVLFNSIRGKYRALLQTENDKEQLNGTWYQGGMQFPLKMERGTSPTPPRPQTPKPPFGYTVEDVKYTNSDKSITLGGTITKPSGNGIYPAVILITGSGPQDRDESLFGHKPFWVIADHLTKNGFAVLRVDDRGVGKSKGETSNATSADFANDVMTSINYLKTRADIDLKKIGLLGHSEGGMIAPLVAAKTKDVAFMVLLAGPAVNGAEVLNAQNVAIMKASGIDPTVVNEIDNISRKIAKIIVDAKTKEGALSNVEDEAKAWLSSASNEAKTASKLTSDDQVKNYVTQIVTQLYSPWFRYFLKFDPAPLLVKSNCPVLALFGEKDFQVLPSQNLEPMKLALAKSRKSKDFTVTEIKGLNHLFQKCITCTVEEYGELTETFSEEALNVITSWLNQTIK